MKINKSWATYTQFSFMDIYSLLMSDNFKRKKKLLTYYVTQKLHWT